MKVKRMGTTEILRRIWLFSANKIKGSESQSESVCKQPTQLIVELNSSLWQKIDTHIICMYIRRPVPSTDQAIPSCFYFRIS